MAALATIFLILTNLLASVTAQIYFQRCYNNGNYTSNSTYKSNLDALLSSLPQSIDDKGFYNASMGQNPHKTYANVLCRGDAQLNTCRSCIKNGTIAIVNLCQNYKQAILWNAFCTLRYSDESMFGIFMTGDPPRYYTSKQNVTSPDQFMADLRTLLDSIRWQAAYGGSLRKVAAGNRSTLDFQTVFSMVQCTPDLSSEDCSNCLIMVASYIPSYCHRGRWCVALQDNCNLIYGDRPYYNETRLQELQALVTPQLQPPPSLLPGKKDAGKTRTIIAVVVSVVMCVIILAVCAGILFIKRTKKQPKDELQSSQDINMAESLQYDFCEIEAATDDFSDTNKLGQGGFGAVYKGKLPNGLEIAVKRLSMDSGQGDIEFKNEVLLVAKLQHRNLVRLLGFSIDGKERLLVYEFVQNASLDRFIFDPIKRSDLDFETRYKIIGGIARGLLYLHEESRLKIIHRDLKAGNILLDGDMNPKISDFGMARLFVTDETQASTNRIVGTYGYMSPEYAIHGHFSVKSDVFSFGVLVLEIVSGQKNRSFQNGEDMEDLLSLAWKSWRQGMIEDMIDPVLRGSSSTLRDMLKCIHIGLLCVQDNPIDRPTMASVVLMLGSFSVSLPVPLEPTYSTITGYKSSNANSQGYVLNEVVTSESSSLNKSTRSIGSSRNDMSITGFYPR